MTMFYIILLIVLGLLFLVAELVLLPGVSIGAILALVCYGSSIYLAFRDYGTVAGVVVILAILLLSLVATIISLRAKTWQRFSLKQRVDSSSMPSTPRPGIAGGRPRHDPFAPFSDGYGRGRRQGLRGQVADGLCRPAPGGRSRGLREFQRHRKDREGSARLAG